MAVADSLLHSVQQAADTAAQRGDSNSERATSELVAVSLRALIKAQHSDLQQSIQVWNVLIRLIRHSYMYDILHHIWYSMHCSW
jgi:hypothetical protein